MKKFKNQRKNFKFEYEFEDGKEAVFTYYESTTKHIDKSLKLEGVVEQLNFTKETLKECLKSEEDGAVEKLIKEQTENGNIYNFSKTLSEELGKSSERE